MKKNILYSICLSLALISTASIYIYQQKSHKQSKLLIEDFFSFEKNLEPLFQNKSYADINKILQSSAPAVTNSKSDLDKNIYEYYSVRTNIEAQMLSKNIISIDSVLGFSDQMLKKLNDIRNKLLSGNSKFETKSHWNAKIEDLTEEIKKYREQIANLKKQK